MSLLLRIVLALVVFIVVTSAISYAFFSRGGDDQPKLGHVETTSR
jgi:hypothetical protein